MPSDVFDQPLGVVGVSSLDTTDSILLDTTHNIMLDTTHNIFQGLSPSPIMSSIHSLAIKLSLTGDCDPDRSLMKAYRDFGLHQLAPSVLVTTVGCDDSRFSSDRLYNSTEKVYPRPTG